MSGLNESGSIGERQFIGALTRVPFVDLAARVARFEPPFEYLRSVKATFDPVERFLLNRALAGDEAAILARESRIQFMLGRQFVGDPPPQPILKALPRFLERHDEDLTVFQREQYPWLVMPEVITTEQPPSLELLDDVIGATMSEYGFDVARRKKTKMEWRCTSKMLPAPMTLYFDRGNWKMTGYIEVPELLYHADVGEPFFFSQIEFRHGDHFEAQVRSFFAEYGKFFPHVIETVERALPIRDRFLSGDRDGALEIARAMAPTPAVPLTEP